jgi:hypothetical protein
VSGACCARLASATKRVRRWSHQWISTKIELPSIFRGSRSPAIWPFFSGDGIVQMAFLQQLGFRTCGPARCAHLWIPANCRLSSISHRFRSPPTFCLSSPAPARCYSLFASSNHLFWFYHISCL